jgi:uncharacterized protein (TIGR00725 family)
VSRPVVTVIGKGLDCPPEVAHRAAEAGAVVAALGAVLVTGGLGGVMRAAARAALDEGGTVVGLIPQGRDRHAFTEGDVIALRTGLPIPYRNALTASVADVAIVLPGSHGTLQEAMVLLHRRVPLLGFGDHDFALTRVLHGQWEGCTENPKELAAALLGLLPESTAVPPDLLTEGAA